MTDGIRVKKIEPWLGISDSAHAEEDKTVTVVAEREVEGGNQRGKPWVTKELVVHPDERPECLITLDRSQVRRR